MSIKLTFTFILAYIAVFSLVPVGLSQAHGERDMITCIKPFPSSTQPVNPASFAHLKCFLDSMQGIERFIRLSKLTLVRKPANVDVDPDVQLLSVEVLILRGDSDWSREEEIKKFARLFPNVSYIECNGCNVFKLGVLSHFKKLRRLKIGGLGLARKIGKGPPQEYDLTGLDYETLSIHITPDLDTNIKCRTLGIWSYKIQEPHILQNIPDGVRPYKSLHTCFPKILTISEKIIEGDRLYQQGKLEEAHQMFLKAYNINPYDQQAISRLSLMYYKKGEVCKAAQVAHSGTVLINGTSNTRAAIWFNYYLALKKLGWYENASMALSQSITYKPSKRKEELFLELSNQTDEQSTAPTECKLTQNWIDELYARIETDAIQRSRSGIADDFCVREPHFISCRRGKVGPCFRSADNLSTCL